MPRRRPRIQEMSRCPKTSGPRWAAAHAAGTSTIALLTAAGGGQRLRQLGGAPGVGLDRLADEGLGLLASVARDAETGQVGAVGAPALAFALKNDQVLG